jgi:CMP-N-acetylneuraminic acid synthetase
MADGNFNIDLLAIVPARGGSKRLPGKNVMLLRGKPLIQWTIDAALDSQVIDLLVVTSDDDTILSWGKKPGVKLIKRPSHLATDTSSTTDVLLHTLAELAGQGIRPKRLMLLQPTSPLRTNLDIRHAELLMSETAASSVISVCPCEHSPLWSNVLGDGASMDEFIRPDVLGKRSQDLPEYYRLNGAIYLADVEIFKAERSFFIKNSKAYVMPAERSVDIDSFVDFKLCEAILEHNAP